MRMICGQCKEYTTMPHWDTDEYVCTKCKSKNVIEAHSKYEVQQLFGVSYEKLQTALEFYKGVVLCSECIHATLQHPWPGGQEKKLVCDTPGTPFTNWGVRPDGFCHAGQRRTDNENN